tara:strand:+ start:105 stop:506 length:402 start_codon:yes stop_codon:yes gene_type:complete
MNRGKTMDEKSMSELLDLLEQKKNERSELFDEIGILELAIKREMEDAEASLFENARWTVKLEPKTKWIEEALKPLDEHYSPEEKEELLNKPKPREWNKTKLNREMKKGGEIKRIIEFAKQKDLPKVTIRKKGK